jgi:hypothetical protein
MEVRMRIAMLYATLALFALGACTVQTEEEGEAPEINVEEGELPEIDVDPANVEIRQDTKTVVVPEVDVDPAEEPQGSGRD